MSKHTAGPWNIHHHYTNPQPFKVDPKDGSTPWMSCQTYVSQDTKIIAQVQMMTMPDGLRGWPTVTDRDEMLANARLIASAPDLLESSERYRTLLEKIEGVIGTPPGTETDLNTLPERVAKAVVRVPDVNADLLAALIPLLTRYVNLANSGDAGNWNPELEQEVIDARAAISKAKGQA